MTLRLPSSGRLAGIDFGTVRVGVAVTDPQQILASPWQTYRRRDAVSDAAYFRQLVSEERIVGFVVGLPVHLSGDESQKSAEARAFGAWLGQVTGLPVAFQDERFSSSEADRLIAETRPGRRKKKADRDRLAAQVILASFLASTRSGETGPLD